MGKKGDLAHIHAAGLALAHVLRGAEELVLDAQAAAKVTPGSAGNNAHLGAASRCHQAVGHFGNRAVATQGDDQLAPLLGFFVRQGASVPRGLGEAGVEDAQPIRDRADHGCPALFAEPTTRARVDDDDRFVHGTAK